MARPLEGRVALITGANKGIGLQIAKELAARGMTVLVGSRDLTRGEAAAKRPSQRSLPPLTCSSLPRIVTGRGDALMIHP